MSGHSKWSTIKHQKAAQDKKRGKLFSRLARAISVAAREGGEDLEANPKLRSAVEQAKEANMPKDNIKRAIKRGSGQDQAGQLEMTTYEGYGPANIAVMVECISDNKNRTAAEIKSFFEKKGRGLGRPGSVAYLFTRKGLIIVKKSADFETQALKLIDLGVDDFEEAGKVVEVLTKPKELEVIKNKIKQAGFKVEKAQISYEPKVPLTVKDQTKKEKILSFLDELDELDDVQKIYCNVDIVD